MKNLYSEDVFALENFEGSLDFLLHLVQKHEIDPVEISLKKITEQYIQKLKEWQASSVDSGAEFIASASFLLWLKSRMLLPTHEQPLSLGEEEHDPRFDIIHQLLDYCRFKEAAKNLTQLEMSQSAYYLREPEPLGENNKPLGIEHLTLEDLADLFKQALAKAPIKTAKFIQEEEWKVADKIKAIRQYLKVNHQLEIEQLFLNATSKLEIIVIFLAVLELMKIGESYLIKDVASQKILLCVNL
ncbi:ScpA family protein [Neochlamydia sp. S13]|uniref:segregation and condensation protein A n=1 Tax=Neochlamydia sp. S13 TaxID=1353976 RepID=UPI0005A67F02|nr:segregation/condensation protein A [Neochlamydia sp. S13]BBI16401.1 Segregation and condensation protein A [Neochlamydia sp. S13]